MASTLGCEISLRAIHVDVRPANATRPTRTIILAFTIADELWCISVLSQRFYGGAGGSCLLQAPGFAHKTITDNEKARKERSAAAGWSTSAFRQI
jgi:hypothetical protein